MSLQNYLLKVQSHCSTVLLAAAAILGCATSSVSAQEIVVGEDADGRLTVKAVRYDGDVSLDGVLDEDIYTQIAPADFNGDRQLDCGDVDALAAAIVDGNNLPLFDLTADDVVDHADLDVWLSLTGLENLPSGQPYFVGDANLDGAIDAKDLNVIGMHWRQSAVGWCDADFNSDGQVDSQDLNLLAANWRKDVSSAAAANQRVPRAPLANHVVAPVVPAERYSVFEVERNDRPTNWNVDLETSKAVSADTLVRHGVRRYVVSVNSRSQLPMRRDLTDVDLQHLVDEVLKRWTSHLSRISHSL